MKLPYQYVINKVQEHVYKIHCDKYGITEELKNLRKKSAFTDILEVWIVENCHAWVDTERTEWTFWTKIDHMRFLTSWP